MEKADVFLYRSSIRAALVAVVVYCFSLSAHAQSDFASKIWWKSDPQGMRANVERALGGTASATLPAAGTPAVNGAVFSNAANQWPDASMRSHLPLPGRQGPVIDVKARVKPASVGKALGNLAGGLLRNVAVPVGIGLTLYNFANDLGFFLDGSSGELVVTSAAPGYCPSGPCYEWSPGSATFYKTPQAAANAFVGTFQSGCGTVTAVTGVYTVGGGHPSYAANLQCAGQSSPLGPFGMTSRSRAVDTVPQTVPSSRQAFEDAVAAKSGWPTSSSINQLVAEAIKYGEPIETATPTVTGPATSPGPKTVTTKPDGTVVTENTTNNYTYNTNVVTVTTTTVTSTFNPSTGTTTTETKTNEPEAPKDECVERPDSLACAELDEPTDKVKKETRTVSYEEQNLFGAGSCPADVQASVATLGATIKVWDWQKTCSMALPLRALVVALALFAASLIVMPVRVEV